MASNLVRELTNVALGNDKTLTTDTERIGLTLEILAFTIAATSNAGTRSIDVVLKNESGQELARLVAVKTAAADATVSGYIYVGSGDGELPPFVLRPGFQLQVVDTADIDVLDTLSVFAYFAGTEVIG